MNPDDLTPVENRQGVLLKRDDLFSVNGERGGKVRTAHRIARDDPHARAGLITAGSRHSPQVALVAAVAAEFGVPCRVHVPTGESTPEIDRAKNHGAEVVRHSPGYNNVINKRAKDDATESGWGLVPFGMEHPWAVMGTSAQVANVPFQDVRRVVVPVGSAMTLAGILHGLARRFDGMNEHARPDVVGLVVGASPVERLDRWAPGWRDQVALVQSPLDYSDHADVNMWDGVEVDPVYEAKALPWLRRGDLFWVVGHRDPFPTRWKISAKWAMHPHDCTLVGITRDGGCGGMCCRNQAFWPPKSGGNLGQCQLLGPDGCTLAPDERPIKCLLYPLIPNDNGTLVRHYRAPSCGPCIGVGPPLIDALDGSLRALFGDAEYDRIRADVHNGKDPAVVLPSNLAAQLEREAEMERRVDVPTSRKETLHP